MGNQGSASGTYNTLGVRGKIFFIGVNGERKVLCSRLVFTARAHTHQSFNTSQRTKCKLDVNVGQKRRLFRLQEKVMKKVDSSSVLLMKKLSTINWKALRNGTQGLRWQFLEKKRKTTIRTFLIFLWVNIWLAVYIHFWQKSKQVSNSGLK